MNSTSSMHHSFDIALGAQYGVEEAVLIHHFQHWIRINQFARRNIRDGKCWTYQTRKSIQEHFPYWNVDRIKYLCEKLVELGVLVTANYNKSSMDKTLWYAFADEKAFSVDYEFSRNLYERQKCPSKGKSALPEGKSAQAIPDTKTTDTKPEDIDNPSPEVEGAKSPPLEKKKKEKPKPSKEMPVECHNTALKLLDKIKEINPFMKAPDVEKWAEEVDLMNRRDNRSWKDIEAMIDWVFDDAFWAKVIHSPSGLRKNWDKIAPQRAALTNKGTIEAENRRIAAGIKTYLSSISRGSEIWIDRLFVRNNKTGDSIKYDLPNSQFEEVLCKWFALRKE